MDLLMAISEGLRALLADRVFWTVLATFLVAHTLKLSIDYYQNKKLTIVSFFRTGGMPSAHTATVVSLTLSVFFAEGVGTLFVAVLFFSVIVVRDSLGVRYSVGQQAKRLNKLLEASGIEDSVKVILGHTPSQVLVGGILGIVVTALVFGLF